MTVDAPDPGSAPNSPAKKASVLGVVAFVLAVMGFLIGWIPFVALVFVLPALVLGVIVLFQKGVAKGLAIAAVILASIALLTNVIITGAVLLGGSASNEEHVAVAEESAMPTPSDSVSTTPSATPAPVVTEETPAVAVTTAAVETPAVVAPPAETAAQKNARKAAESYLAFMPFSRSGLIKQLGFEGYAAADAEYGIDALKVDWNEQAARAAKNYLDMMAFSRSGLITQLEFEGYTNEQASYGVGQNGL